MLYGVCRSTSAASARIGRDAVPYRSTRSAKSMRRSRRATVARAFTLFFLLVNTAEQVHRVRRRQWYERRADAHEWLEARGWSRADAASFFSAFLLGSGFGIVTLGWLISRLGVRLPSAIMAAVFGLSFASIALLPADPILFWLLFFIVGFGGAACTAMPDRPSIISTLTR